MEAFTLLGSTAGSDVFSISDQALSDRLQFVQEIGFGNWGSVWLCHSKLSRYAGSLGTAQGQKIAVKLVHRSKTSTTAARVRSLWNEMKIVRNFKNDLHPSIISFHSFVLTPSYALITMAYFPTLVPVEVEEFKAKEWFHSLLSGVEFLHQRGVVHNDIKPANILLSHENIPVLVDFGFAEKYKLDSPTAFHSNLSYGTPEYLSPERARGIPHDTRKSDVWSLGITFFEILVGRTPFENTDGERLNTKDDLENYWQRTLCGTWIGDWKMTAEMEKLLQCMIAPNADLRCTASQAMADEMWLLHPASTKSHKRATSANDTSVFEKAPNMTTRPGKEKIIPSSPDNPATPCEDISTRALVKSRSQLKVAAKKAKKHPYIPLIPDLSPIKASPPTTPLKYAAGKENIAPPKGRTSTPPRQLVGVLTSRNGNLPQANMPINKTTKEKSRAPRSIMNRSMSRTNSRNAEDISLITNQRGAKESTSVRDRVRDWEKERKRLREMARLEETERERDEELEKGTKREKPKRKLSISIREHEVYSKEDYDTAVFNKIVSPSLAITPSLAQGTNKMPTTGAPSRPSSVPDKRFRHAIRSSIDKTFGVYRLSTFTHGTNGSTSAHSLGIDIGDIRPEINTPFTRGGSQAQSWKHEVNSSLPMSKQSEKVTTDSHIDRLTIWMQNVERVIEDARQGFAASTRTDASLPSLPVAPRNVSNGRNARSSRLPRKVLTASQIFVEYNNLTTDTSSSANTSALATLDQKSSSCGSSSVSSTPSNSVFCTPASTDSAQMQLLVQTPSRKRRTTVSEDSPAAVLRDTVMTPSKGREKSQSHGHFLQQQIASISRLEAEINKPVGSESSQRLSEMFDRGIFIATPLRPCEILKSPHASADDLCSSPYHVEPYPERKITFSDGVPDTSQQRELEGVYDRFLMATSGVKRVGKGYQSDFIPPRPSASKRTSLGSGAIKKRHSRMFFGAPKTPMLPPISSEDVVQRRGVSVDEMGVISYGPVSARPDDVESTGPLTVSFVRKAIKAIVPSSKRPSRMVVA